MPLCAQVPALHAAWAPFHYNRIFVDTHGQKIQRDFWETLLEAFHFISELGNLTTFLSQASPDGFIVHMTATVTHYLAIGNASSSGRVLLAQENHMGTGHPVALFLFINICLFQSLINLAKRHLIAQNGIN